MAFSMSMFRIDQRPVTGSVWNSSLRFRCCVGSAVPSTTPTVNCAHGVTPGTSALRRILPVASFNSERIHATPVLIVVGVSSASVCGTAMPSGPAGISPSVLKMPLATCPTFGSV